MEAEIRAMLIGTSEYQDERFPALPTADNSLEGMTQWSRVNVGT